jgi:hypothetical protein
MRDDAAQNVELEALSKEFAQEIGADHHTPGRHFDVKISRCALIFACAMIHSVTHSI